jgi:hypothetical protein
MKSEPLSVKSFALLLVLPIAFFVTSSGAILFSSGYLLRHPINIPKLLGVGENNYSAFGSQPPPAITLGVSYVPEEARPELLRHFLASYNSPLTPYADYILEISEKYGLDWRLLTGIAGNESLFGRVVPYESHNAWGWGIHSRGTLKFSSWEEGIEKVAKGIKENYVDKGLATIDLIMTKYAPVSVANGYPWADNVRFFMERLEQGKGYRE